MPLPGPNDFRDLLVSKSMEMQQSAGILSVLQEQRSHISGFDRRTSNFGPRARLSDVLKTSGFRSSRVRPINYSEKATNSRGSGNFEIQDGYLSKALSEDGNGDESSRARSTGLLKAPSLLRGETLTARTSRHSSSLL